MREASEGSLTDKALRRSLLANTGREIGWLVAMARLGVPIAGVHSHILDTAGHIYADRPRTLRKYYMLVDELIGDLRRSCDQLVVLSDHGIQTTETDDDQVGRHSMRAMIGAQNVDGLPETVYDVREWLYPQLDEPSVIDDRVAGMDTPDEHLRDLGYM